MPRLVAIALLCAPIFVVPATATLLGGDGGALVSGAALVAECDDEQTVDYRTEAGLVTGVVVGGIADPQCSGGRLSVALTATSDGVATGDPVTVPSDADADDDSVTVPVSPAAPAAQVDRTDVLIEAVP